MVVRQVRHEVGTAASNRPATDAASSNPNNTTYSLGGNNIHNTKQTQLIKFIVNDLKYLRNTLTSTHIVWCDILPRQQWRDNTSSSPKELNVKRKRINHAARKCIKEMQNASFISPKIPWHITELFLDDGVNLSDMSNMVYHQTLK
ncbi:hypothetical protein ACF0H5_014399 [Mactra antiquata]